MTTVPQIDSQVQEPDFPNIVDDLTIDIHDDSDGHLDEILFLAWLWRNCADFAHDVSDAMRCEPGYPLPILA